MSSSLAIALLVVATFLPFYVLHPVRVQRLRWLTLTHSVRWHTHHHSTGSGHVYQNRFKAFPVAEDDHGIARFQKSQVGGRRFVRKGPQRLGAQVAGLALAASAAAE